MGAIAVIAYAFASAIATAPSGFTAVTESSSAITTFPSGEIITEDPSGLVITVDPSGFYNTVDPSLLATFNPASVIVEVKGYMAAKAAIEFVTLLTATVVV